MQLDYKNVPFCRPQHKKCMKCSLQIWNTLENGLYKNSGSLLKRRCEDINSWIRICKLFNFLSLRLQLACINRNVICLHRKLEDLIIENGGQPIRSAIFTTWRSGSTFLGEALDNNPGTFYHYEPLLHFEIKQASCYEINQFT